MWRVRACTDEILRARRSRQRWRTSRRAIAQGRRGRSGQQAGRPASPGCRGSARPRSAARACARDLCDLGRSQGRVALAAAVARRPGDRAARQSGTLAASGTRHRRSLCRLSAGRRQARRGRRARWPGRGLCPQGDVAARARRLSREPRHRRRRRPCARSTRRCGRSTASGSPTTRSIPTPPRRASASTSPIRWRAARSISRPMSPSRARPMRLSRSRSRSSASTASSMASATPSCCARACPPPSTRRLLKSADYEIYVRDRSPQVRFTGKNYVLPRIGQEGIPVVSVNTAKLAVEIFRVGDRNLLSTVAPRISSRQLGALSARQIADENGVKIWNGTLDVRNELNQDVITAFPVIEAVGKLEPGVYVMIAQARRARPLANADEDYGQRGDAVVRRLRSRPDRIHRRGRRACAGALARQRRAARRTSKSASSPATTRCSRRRQTDADGHVAFDPGLSRGEGGLAPGLVVASDGKRRLRLPRPRQCRLRPHRSRREGPRSAGRGSTPSSTPSAASIAPARPCMLTALLRDAKGVAVARPAADHRRRAAGRRRISPRRRRRPGRWRAHFSLPLLSAAASGTWRVEAYADPKGPAIGETSFLVEDYVPERLEFDLKPQRPARGPASRRADRPSTGAISTARPAPTSTSTGEYVDPAVDESRLPGLDGYQVGLQDEDFETVAERDRGPPHDRRAGSRDDVSRPAGRRRASSPLEAKITLRVGEPGGRAVERTVVAARSGPKARCIGVKKLFGAISARGRAGHASTSSSSRPTARRIDQGRDHWSL